MIVGYENDVYQNINWVYINLDLQFYALNNYFRPIYYKLDSKILDL